MSLACRNKKVQTGRSYSVVFYLLPYTDIKSFKNVLNLKMAVRASPDDGGIKDL
jgi:hypothetical protein